MDERMQLTHLMRIVPQYWKSKLVENRNFQNPTKAIAHIQMHQRWNRCEKPSAARAGKPEASINAVQEQPSKNRRAPHNDECHGECHQNGEPSDANRAPSQSSQETFATA